VSGLRISSRERRTIALAAAVSVAALVLAWGILPFARRWQEREHVIAVQLQQLAQMRGLLNSQSRLNELVFARTSSLDAAGRQRLLSARTPALAASALQSTLQRFADESQVTVSRLDVAGAPDTTGTVPMIPATLSATGDIYGVTDLLARIQHGTLLLEITELQVRPNPALYGELLQMTVTLRGAYLGG
jgi:hypothetical protein